MLKIYSAESIIDAQLLCDLLGDHRIEAIVKGGYLTGAIGELPPDQLVSVWIADGEQKEQAAEIIKDFEARRQIVGKDVFCPHCGEVNQSSFRLCWSCSESLNHDGG